MMAIVAGFLASSIRVGTPLLFASTGEVLTERSGVINLGIEGAMLAGAFAAAVGGMWGGPWAGLAAGAFVGGITAALFALVAIVAQADQIITGTAITLGAVGLTGALYRVVVGTGTGLTLETFVPVRIPGLSSIPVVGPALFTQPAPTLIAFGLAPLCWWFLFRTPAGLALRAAGESPTSARAAGVRVRLVRTLATVAGGVCSGLGGATLVLAQVGTFAEKMTAGRGYVAIAIVVLGRWHPLGVVWASLLFGAATALQFLFQAMGLRVPYQLFLMLPYALAVLALAGAVGRTRAPAGLGRGG